MDPFAGLADFILGRLKESLLGQWFKFLFEMAFSGIASFLFIGGSFLVTTKSWPIGVGSGMISAAVSMISLFRKEQSRLTKGMLVVLPAEEATKELATDLQNIEKSK